jgi:hypothetical protein
MLFQRKFLDKGAGALSGPESSGGSNNPRREPDAPGQRHREAPWTQMRMVSSTSLGNSRNAVSYLRKSELLAEKSRRRSRKCRRLIALAAFVFTSFGFTPGRRFLFCAVIDSPKKLQFIKKFSLDRQPLSRKGKGQAVEARRVPLADKSFTGLAIRHS